MLVSPQGDCTQASADWEAEKSALPPSALWAVTSYTHIRTCTQCTHTILQENKWLSMKLTRVFEGTTLVTPRSFSSHSHMQKGGCWGPSSRCGGGYLTLGIRSLASLPFISVALTVCSKPCRCGDTPEKEETRWAIFHHYILHFLINEIQSTQTASLVDHHLSKESQT